LHSTARQSEPFRFGDFVALRLVARLERAPQIAARLQQFPFAVLDDRNGVLGVTAHRRAAIEGRALLAAVINLEIGA